VPPTSRTPGAGPRAWAAACAAAVLLVAGCGGDDEPAGEASGAPTEGLGTVTVAEDGVQEVTLRTQDDYVFTPDRFTVAPGTVRLTLVNVATEMPHNFEFTRGGGPEEIAAGISLVGPGEEKTIEFTVTQPGDHAFECSFHVQVGQVGTMTVRG
jgi:plastocyanin